MKSQLNATLTTLVLVALMLLLGHQSQASEIANNPMLLDCISKSENTSAPCHEPYTKAYDKIPNPFFKNDLPTEVVIINGNAYVQGDIFVGTEKMLDDYQAKNQDKPQFKSITADLGRWPNGVIPFEILDGFSAQERGTIIGILNTYANTTNVCFRPGNSGTARIKFKKYSVSDLGFSGGSSELGKCLTCLDGQEVKLSAVSHRLVTHEVGHALGLLHEHTRENRDSFVSIL